MNNLARISRTGLVLASFGGSGCALLPTHLHDLGKAASATQLHNELTTYRENAPSMYQAMLANLQEFKVEEDKLIADLAANRDKALVTQLPTQNQTQLVDLKKQVTDRIGQLESAIRDQASKYLKEKGVNEKELSDAKVAVRKAKELVAAAKKDVTNWNATLALLKTGIAELPSIGESTAKETTKDSLSEIPRKLKDVGEKEVEFIDADGKTQKKKIKDILEDEIRGKGKEPSILSLPDAPGITLVILTFGLELAGLQQKSAESRLSQLHRRAEVYEDSLAEGLLAKQLLSETNFGVAADITIYHDLQRLAARARAHRQELSAVRSPSGSADRWEGTDGSRSLFETVNTTITVLQDLRKLALADSITARTKAMLRLAESRLDHEDSIMLSRLNDEAWQALLKGGAEGLLAYHKGGFTREDAANIIRIAQSIALGFIAGRVD